MVNDFANFDIPNEIVPDSTTVISRTDGLMMVICLTSECDIDRKTIRAHVTSEKKAVMT